MLIPGDGSMCSRFCVWGSGAGALTCARILTIDGEPVGDADFYLWWAWRWLVVLAFLCVGAWLTTLLVFQERRDSAPMADTIGCKLDLPCHGTLVLPSGRSMDQAAGGRQG
jgi:hypothetical protein